MGLIRTGQGFIDDGSAVIFSEDVIDALGYTPEDEANKGVSNGYASLDGGGKVPVSELPAIATEGLNFQGTWNATTNTPALASGVGTEGDWYIVSVGGTTDLDGNNSWDPKDWAIFKNGGWNKVDNVDPPIVTPVIDSLTVNSNGQTIFTLSQTPVSALNDLLLILNGTVYFQALNDFSVSGTTLTWNDPGGLTLQTIDTLIVYYNSPAIVSSNIKEFQLAGVDYNSNFNGTVRTRSVAGTGNQNFTFRIPDDLNTLISADIKFGVNTGAAGSGKDIDIISTYAFDNEIYNQNSESDLATVYDFTGYADKYASISLLPVLQNVQAGHNVAINIDHNGIGAALEYTLIRFRYV